MTSDFGLISVPCLAGRGSGDTNTSPMNTPIPPDLAPLPPLLTAAQVQRLLEFWNLGSRRYFCDMRECGVLVSANGFPHGQRARYAARDVLRLYPVAETSRN